MNQMSLSPLGIALVGVAARFICGRDQLVENALVILDDREVSKSQVSAELSRLSSLKLIEVDDVHHYHATSRGLEVLKSQRARLQNLSALVNGNAWSLVGNAATLVEHS